MRLDSSQLKVNCLSFHQQIDDEDCDDPVDEYITFQAVIAAIMATDPQYYALLTSALSAEQSKALNELLVVAEQKKAQYASKKIERQGGTHKESTV